MKTISVISLSLALTTLALCLDNSNAPFFSLVERLDKGTHRAELKSINEEIVVKLAEGPGLNYLKLFRNGEEIVTVYVNSETNQIEYVVLTEDTKANPIILRSINSKGEVTGRVEVPLDKGLGR